MPVNSEFVVIYLIFNSEEGKPMREQKLTAGRFLEREWAEDGQDVFPD